MDKTKLVAAAEEYREAFQEERMAKLMMEQVKRQMFAAENQLDEARKRREAAHNQFVKAALENLTTEIGAVPCLTSS